MHKLIFYLAAFIATIRAPENYDGDGFGLAVIYFSIAWGLGFLIDYIARIESD